ncbi:MAG: Rho termination factor N-terminal domain-containing protein, partial [bacterium]
MHTIDELNDKLISELKELAEGLGVKNAKKLAKEELVYKILDQQAVTGTGSSPAPKKSNEGGDPERKMRPRKRENVAPAPAEVQPEKGNEEVSSEEMLKSLDFQIDQRATSFEEQPTEAPSGNVETPSQQERREDRPSHPNQQSNQQHQPRRE